MTTCEQKVKDLCDEVYTKNFTQIVIDLVQDIIEGLIGKEDLTSGDIGAAAYDTDIISDVMNPKFEIDCDYLKRMYAALNDWENDHRQTNILLGIPREK